MKPYELFEKTGELPKIGEQFKTKIYLTPADECRGFYVKDKHLDTRRSDVIGKYVGYVPGCGGDVWWIEHEDGSIGAYLYNELTDV